MSAKGSTALADDAIRRARGRPEVAVRRLRVASRAALLGAVVLLDTGTTGDRVLAAVNRARQLLRAAEHVRRFTGVHPGAHPGVSAIYRSNTLSMYPTKGPKYPRGSGLE